MLIRPLSQNPDGAVIDVSADEGEMMIRRGVAELVETPPDAREKKSPVKSASPKRSDRHGVRSKA